MIDLTRQYGRCGYRRIAALLRDAGWHVNDKRVERLWRREGLKVLMKQPQSGLLWLNDGLCVRLRPEHLNHVWSYDFVHCRTDDGRAFRPLNIIDEYSRECLAIRVDRKLNSCNVIDALSDLFILRGVPSFTGAVAQLVFGSGTAFGTAMAAIGSGMLTALVVLLLARRDGAGSGYRLVLVGMGVGAVLTGINTMLLAKGGLDRVASAQLWLAGSLSARNWGHVWIVGVGLALFVPVVTVLGPRLKWMELGEDMARQLGLSVSRTRMSLVLAAVGLTSLSTAATGPIAFIALAAPQIARRLSRNGDVPLLSAALTGMVLVLTADFLSQWANGPMAFWCCRSVSSRAVSGGSISF